MAEMTWLLGAHRSGTTLLRECLDTSPSIVSLDEVFVQYRQEEKNFFHYLLDRTREDPQVALPSEAARQALYREYVEFLDSLYPQIKNLVADIKYAQTHHFDGINRRFYERPAILKYAIDRGDSFVHLIRKNVLESYVSALVARQNQSHRARSKMEVRDAIIHLDCSTLIKVLHYRTEEIQLFHNWLSDHTAVVTCYYEDLVDNDGNVSVTILGNIADLLHCPADFERTPKRQKLGYELSHTVSNFDEVRHCLANTEHEWMLG